MRETTQRTMKTGQLTDTRGGVEAQAQAWVNHNNLSSVSDDGRNKQIMIQGSGTVDAERICAALLIMYSRSINAYIA